MARRRIPQDTYCFKYFNKNPKNKSTGDCVIRAIAAALNQSWDETFRELCMLSLKYKLMPNDKSIYSRYLKEKGWVMHPAPRKADNTRYRGTDFHEVTRKDVIAHIGGHHIVYIHAGVVWDTWNSTSGSIGNYWTKGE